METSRGAFFSGLIRGWFLPSVARLASATAALDTQSLGGAALPTLAQVQVFLDQHTEVFDWTPATTGRFE